MCIIERNAINAISPSIYVEYFIVHLSSTICSYERTFIVERNFKFHIRFVVQGTKPRIRLAHSFCCETCLPWMRRRNASHRVDAPYPSIKTVGLFRAATGGTELVIKIVAARARGFLRLFRRWRFARTRP